MKLTMVLIDEEFGKEIIHTVEVADLNDITEAYTMFTKGCGYDYIEEIVATRKCNCGGCEWVFIS